MELKQELAMMSPPASDSGSGSGSPPQLSLYCVDSEPGSPLLDHEQVTDTCLVSGHSELLEHTLGRFTSKLINENL